MSAGKNTPWDGEEEKKSDPPGTTTERDLNEDEQRKITNQTDAEEGEQEENSEFYVDASGDTIRRSTSKKDKEIENL